MQINQEDNELIDRQEEMLSSLKSQIRELQYWKPSNMNNIQILCEKGSTIQEAPSYDGLLLKYMNLQNQVQMEEEHHQNLVVQVQVEREQEVYELNLRYEHCQEEINQYQNRIK